MLVSYSLLLENNFNRLKSMDLEHEMSNTSAMTSIVRKFPRLIAEKWNEHLSLLESSVLARPFAAFIQWLGSQREMWERMAATEMVRKRSEYQKPSGSFFVEDVKGDVNRCFACGEEGHIKEVLSKKEWKV